jgi:hypothetical protein
VFPVRKQDGLLGLEAPLSLLSAIAGGLSIIEFEHGYILKGRSVMLVPVAKSNGNIQWHAVTSNGDRLRVSQLRNLGIARLGTSKLSRDELQNPGILSFVGWCDESKHILGMIVDHTNPTIEADICM